MIYIDQYKIESIDFDNFKEEYDCQQDYLWDYKKELCPKEKFFILNGYRFLKEKEIAQRFAIESSEKNYLSQIEYVAVMPTDLYVFFDFYLAGLYEKHDINYILSYKEIELYAKLKKDKKYIELDKKKWFSNNGFFLLFVNEETRERKFEIIHVDNMKKLEEHISSYKIQDFYLKMKVELNQMNYYFKLFERYKNEKVSQEERKEILELFDNPFLGKPSPVNLIEIIDDEINKQLDSGNKKEEYTIEEQALRHVNFLYAKRNVLINYKSIYNDYHNKIKEKNILEDEGIDIERILDDITLYRHSENYFSNLLDQSYKNYLEDKKLIEDAFIKVMEELREFEKSNNKEKEI